MRVEIAKMSRMAQRGSSLLRLIQNSHTPILDLLIRESVQNSVDAAKNRNNPINYDISIKNFSKHNVSKHFDEISNKLDEKFAEEEQTSIVIKDSNTTGLIGPIHHDYIENEKYGNLLKLVYEISMPQEKKEAGGSWGLGKTIYFRIGIGLVVYYSRIKREDGQYESRLAACLVEDESSEEALLPSDSNTPKRGIAWWGEEHSEGSTKPVTDEAEINEILSDLNVTPYVGEETGTTVIIPFIKPETLIAKRDNQEEVWWHKSLEYYLEIALQRWYAPRIDNPFYRYGSYLNPSVNGKSISKNNMEPVFSLYRSLYIAAQDPKSDIQSNIISKKDLKVHDIKVHRDLSDSTAGKVAFVKIRKESLRMTVPDNKKSPYDYLDLINPSDSSNSPIIAYLRKPGMIVRYETEGKWTNGIDRTITDEYIIGIFVPNSENIVTSSADKISLDEYLRKGEKADHSSWSDITFGDKKYTIVERIQKKVASSVKEAYNSDQEKKYSTKSGALSKSLAQSLLPPVGFGESPGKPTGGTANNGGISKKNKIGSLHVTDTTFDESGQIILSFEAVVPKNTEQAVIEIQIDSEGNRKIKGDEWEKDDVIGTAFPAEMAKIELDQLDSKETETNMISYARTKYYNITYSAEIKVNNIKVEEIRGRIFLFNHDPMVQASIRHEFQTAKENHA